MGKERDSFYKNLPKVITRSPIKTVRIGERLVGEGQPTFIIAEVSANHGGTLESAKKMIDVAAEAKADAVKFQHYKSDKIAADTEVFEEWYDKPIGKLSGFYKSGELPYEWTEELAKHAKERGIIFLSAPFDEEAVDILEKYGAPAFKVASYELTADSLLTYIAKKGKPMIVSTGMSYLEEVTHAIDVINQAGNDQIILMHCVSIYPTSHSDANLSAIQAMREALKIPVGFSDHTPPRDLAAPLAAVALGACAIEKHFTASRSGGSVDDPHSMEPTELANLVREIRNVEAALSGSGIKQPVSRPPHGRGDEVYDRWARRSLYAKTDLKAGEVITEDAIMILRPYGGIEPRHQPLIMGRKIIRDIKKRQPITWDDLLAS